MQSIKLLLQRPLYRYLVIGGSVYLFELLLIIIAQHFGASDVWAATISFSLGTLLSFFLQKLVTFGDKRMHHRILVPQLVATILLVLFNLGFTILMVKILQNQLPTVVIRTVALGITTIWNFYLYKTQIFKGADQPVG